VPLGDAGPGIGGPTTAPSPGPTHAHASPPAPNAHLGTWSCFETYDLAFTSPLGATPVHNTRSTTATVVENGDHTVTTSYTADGETCAWRSRVAGNTAIALPGQSCRNSGGGIVLLTSGTTIVNGSSATIHSTTNFAQNVQRGFQTVRVVGNGSSSISCRKQ
jgi:hypothetical protein